MGQVVVKVNGREFQLTCADGQETRTRRLAQYVDCEGRASSRKRSARSARRG